MDAQEGKSLLESVRPPRLEDAGLEDCALPPEAIKEAFLKAAASIRSAFNGRDCVEDAGPSDGDLHDSLVGDEAPMPCGSDEAVKESSPERCGSKVIGVGEEASDRVVGVEVPKEERGRACVDGLPEEIEGEDEEEERGWFERNEEKREEEEEEEEEDRPILAEVCI